MVYFCLQVILSFILRRCMRAVPRRTTIMVIHQSGSMRMSLLDMIFKLCQICTLIGRQVALTSFRKLRQSINSTAFLLVLLRLVKFVWLTLIYLIDKKYSSANISAFLLHKVEHCTIISKSYIIIVAALLYNMMYKYVMIISDTAIFFIIFNPSLGTFN